MPARAIRQTQRSTDSLDIAFGDDGGVSPIDSTFVSETVFGLRTASIERTVSVPFSVPGDGPASAGGLMGLDSFRVAPLSGDLGFVEFDFAFTLAGVAVVPAPSSATLLGLAGVAAAGFVAAESAHENAGAR